MFHSSITTDVSASNSIKFPIPGYPNYYADVDGNIWSGHYGRMKILRPSVQRTGYLMYNLWIAKKVSWQYGHTLIAITFHGPRPDPSWVVAHRDPTKTNNAVNNLWWCSRRDNSRDWVESGAAHGRPGGPKLTPNDVRAIRKEKLTGVTNRSLADRYGVGLDAIRCVLNRTTWGHVE